MRIFSEIHSFGFSQWLTKMVRHSAFFRVLYGHQVIQKNDVSRAFYRHLVRKSWAKRFQDGADTFNNWIAYGISTNIRGNWLFHFLANEVSFAGKRVLDVGCGFGGHSIAALRWGCSHVSAVDIAPYYTDLTQVNIQTHPQVNPALAQVFLLDITDQKAAQMVAAQGCFDVIIIMDVLEHVKDLAGAFANLKRLLHPDGILVAGIPNGQALSCVLNDPHLGIFGISLLEGDQAEITCQFVKGQSYAFMGSFPCLNTLRGFASCWGSELKIIDGNEDPVKDWHAAPHLLRQITERIASEKMAETVQENFRKILTDYVCQTQSRFMDCPPVISKDDLFQNESTREIYQQYIQNYWYLIINGSDKH